VLCINNVVVQNSADNVISFWDLRKENGRFNIFLTSRGSTFTAMYQQSEIFIADNNQNANLFKDSSKKSKQILKDR
jgi:hypothetical protein